MEIDFNKKIPGQLPSKEEQDLAFEEFSTRVMACVDKKMKEKGYASIDEVNKEACPEVNLRALLNL